MKKSVEDQDFARADKSKLLSSIILDISLKFNHVLSHFLSLRNKKIESSIVSISFVEN